MYPKKAIEIKSDGRNWINSGMISLGSLRGKIVLLDFWTYSCINCQRTLPFLKKLWERYKDMGLVVVGVHTPEFEFEKKLENVRKAVKKLGIGYPVLSDPERINWENYGNMYWPRVALIYGGEIILEHIGEAGYEEIERKIIELLDKSGKKIDCAEIGGEKLHHPISLSRRTYAGSLRNAGIPGRICRMEGTFFDLEKYEKDVINLHGEWVQEPEYLEFTGGEGYLTIKNYASNINAVLEGKGKARVLLDGKDVEKRLAGDDIVFENKGSFVKIDGADMYNLVKGDKQGDHLLKIVPSRGTKVYSLTFG